MVSKAEQTKKFIIEKTAPIFNKKGFGGTSLSDITTATGLTKGSIYGNFANKDEVALAAFDYNLQKITNIISAEISKHKTAKDQLMVYVDVYDNFLKHPFPEGGCPIMNTATECDDTHPELKKKANDAINNWKKGIIRIIETGIAEKEFNSNVDAEKIALSMIATIEGAIMITKLTGKINYRNSIMETVKDMINNL
jgi:TetR/AcrR family transcriptional repressor of nem operon